MTVLGLRPCESPQWTWPLVCGRRNPEVRRELEAGDRGLGAFSIVTGVDKITKENTE